MTNGNKAIFRFIRFAFGILIALMVIYAATQLAEIGYDFGYDRGAGLWRSVLY